MGGRGGGGDGGGHSPYYGGVKGCYCGWTISQQFCPGLYLQKAADARYLLRMKTTMSMHAIIDGRMLITGGSRVGPFRTCPPKWPIKGYYVLKLLKFCSKVMSECRKCHIRDTNFKHFPGKHTLSAIARPLKIIPGSASDVNVLTSFIK